MGICSSTIQRIDSVIDFKYLKNRLLYENSLIERIIDGVDTNRDVLVSVIIPLYGVPIAYFRDLIRSLERQTYKNFEVCFCNDKDPVKAVVSYAKDLCRKDSKKYKIIEHTKNLGICFATQSAISLSSGDILAFVDADDVLHDRCLEVLVNRFSEDEEVDFVYSDHDLCNDFNLRFEPLRKPGWSPELLQSLNYINHITAIKRCCLDKIEEIFPDRFNGSQDWDLCFKVARHARKVTNIPIPLYHWRCRKGSVSIDPDSKPWAFDAALQCRLEHLQKIDKRLGLSDADISRHSHSDPVLDEKNIESLPVLNFVTTKGEFKSKIRYPGNKVNLIDWTGSADDLKHIIERVSADDLMLFVDGTKAPLTGIVSPNAAYAIQPMVFSVYPFRTDGLRCGYFLKDKGHLTPIQKPRGAFSYNSGNILAGSLHGMLVQGSKLKSVPLNQWFSEEDWEKSGIQLAMESERRGYRNVAAKGLQTDEPLRPHQSHSILFNRDYYL